MSKELLVMDMAGCTIDVHSEVDKGSRFDVMLTLPIDHSMEREVSASGILLISDDEALIRNTSKEMQTYCLFSPFDD